ncbi:MAG TPA: DUF1206 domain-containing protein [Pirellulales bacterium]
MKVPRRFFNPLRHGVDPAAKWIEYLGRTGYLARAVVYGLVGLLTGYAAITTTRGPDTTEAMGAVRSLPLGAVLLIIVALGLLCFALWRFVEAVWDTDHRGRNLRGLLVRFGYLVAGIANLVLASIAARIAWSGRRPRGRDRRELAADVMAWPGGWLLVAVVGITVFSIGIGYFVVAWRARFMAGYDHTEMSDAERKLAKLIARFGLASRGVAFCVIGLFLALAGWQTNAGNVKTLGGAVAAAAVQPYGRILLLIIAAGFIAYSIYCLSQAKYKRFAR